MVTAHFVPPMSTPSSTFSVISFYEFDLAFLINGMRMTMNSHAAARAMIAGACWPEASISALRWQTS
jgi:hypothetical protein